MKYFNKNKRTVKDKSYFYICAWQFSLIQHMIMTEVVDKYGWKGLTPQHLKDSMNNVKDFMPLGGLTRVTYSDKRRAPKVAMVYTIKNGRLTPQTDFLEVPDLRPAKYK